MELTVNESENVAITTLTIFLSVKEGGAKPRL